MNHFELKGGELHCEDVSLAAIAQAVGTPVYVYSTATFERHYTVFRDAFRAYPALGEPLVAYAVKANSNVRVDFAEAARLYANASNNAHLRPVGVTCHIGSQITDLAPLKSAYVRLRGLVEQLRGEGFTVERLDLGGGLGVPYFNM